MGMFAISARAEGDRRSEDIVKKQGVLVTAFGRSRKMNFTTPWAYIYTPQK
jgi:hypothetical protein